VTVMGLELAKANEGAFTAMLLKVAAENPAK
jgi:hypothetical protein